MHPFTVHDMSEMYQYRVDILGGHNDLKIVRDEKFHLNKTK